MKLSRADYVQTTNSKTLVHNDVAILVTLHARSGESILGP